MEPAPEVRREATPPGVMVAAGHRACGPPQEVMSVMPVPRTLAELVDSGAIRPIVGSTFPLSRTGEAIAVAGSGHARGKVVVDIAEDD